MARGKKVLKLRAQAKVSTNLFCCLVEKRDRVTQEQDERSEASMEWLKTRSIFELSCGQQCFFWVKEGHISIVNGFLADVHIQKGLFWPCSIVCSCLTRCLFRTPCQAKLRRTRYWYFLCLSPTPLSIFVSLSHLSTEVQLQVPRHRCAANCHRQVLPCWGPRQCQGSYPCQKRPKDQSFHHSWNCLDLVGWQIPRQACRRFEDSFLWFDPCLW